MSVDHEHYRVKKYRCPISGIVTLERWENTKGELHNPDGPALVARDQSSGHTTSIRYAIDGHYHRPNGEPAQLEFDPQSGACIHRSFFINGMPARPDGLPHIEWVDPDTSIVYQAEYWDDRPEWDRPKRHRTDGPALLTFNRVSGEESGAAFYVNGRKRANLPNPDPTPE
ncbi:MAG: hypothetical protein AAGK02_00370 [Pseudomonadota bacterium]